MDWEFSLIQEGGLWTIYDIFPFKTLRENGLQGEVHERDKKGRRQGEVHGRDKKGGRERRGT